MRRALRERAAATLVGVGTPYAMIARHASAQAPQEPLVLRAPGSLCQRSVRRLLRLGIRWWRADPQGGTAQPLC